jgi:hypothetical protein
MCGFGGVFFISVFVILGVLVPSYSFAHDTISALEFTPMGTAQRINFFVFGLLLSAFAAGLRRELSPGFGAALIPVLQLFSGIGVIGDAIFIHNPLHMACDLIAFNSALLLLFSFAWRFRRESGWSGWGAYSVATAILMMAFLAAFGYFNHAGGPAGLLEKLAASMRTLWSAIFAARLLAGKSLTKQLG